jgi:hypothetical protein
VGGWTVCRQVESRSACLVAAWQVGARQIRQMRHLDDLDYEDSYALQCGQSSSSVQIDKLLWSGESQFF